MGVHTGGGGEAKRTRHSITTHDNTQQPQQPQEQGPGPLLRSQVKREDGHEALAPLQALLAGIHTLATKQAQVHSLGLYSTTYLPRQVPTGPCA